MGLSSSPLSSSSSSILSALPRVGIPATELCPPSSYHAMLEVADPEKAARIAWTEDGRVVMQEKQPLRRTRRHKAAQQKFAEVRWRGGGGGLKGGGGGVAAGVGSSVSPSARGVGGLVSLPTPPHLPRAHFSLACTHPAHACARDVL